MESRTEIMGRFSTLLLWQLNWA